MIIENLSTLKIHKLTQEQYDRELANGNIDEAALYLTPEEEIDLSGCATVEQMNGKADSIHVHTIDDVADLQTALDTMSEAITNKANSTHTHIVSDITNLESILNTNLETAKSYTDDKTANLASIDVVNDKADKTQVATDIASAVQTETEARATAIAGVQSEVDTLKSVVVNNKSAIEATVSTLEQTVSANESDIEGKMTSLTSRVAANETAVQTTLPNAISTEQTRAEGEEEKLAEAIASVKEDVDAFFADANMTANAKDTLKELQEYIASDETAASEMLASIRTNADAIDALETAIGTKANASHNHDASNITSGTISADRLPSSTTSAKGIVQLTNSTSSTSTTTAATPSSVKTAYDLANTAKTAAATAQATADGAYTLAESKAVIKTLTSEDLNDVVKEGFYNAGGGNTVTNKPSGIEHFGLYVIHRANGDYYTQILIGNNTKSYRRHCNNGTWDSWSEDKLTDTTYTLSSFGVTATASELNKLDGVTATTTELNYMDGVTSNVQTQLDAKQASITGAASTITGSNLTANRALVSNGSGKVANSSVTSTELGYLSGVSSNIQTQLDGKENVISWSAVTQGLTWSRICLVKATTNSVGWSGILSVGFTRGNVVGNATFAINASHSSTVYITQLNANKYTSFQIRGVTDSYANNTYIEIYDNANSIASGTNQTVYCRFIPILGCTVTKYTSFTSGATIPSGYTAGSVLAVDVSGGSMVASKFVGNLTGTASKATADANGNNIANTYAVKSDIPDYITTGAKSGTTIGQYATAEGKDTTASGIYSHAEGRGTTASSQASHAEGEDTTACSFYSHAEGLGTMASGAGSHAEGALTTASGFYSHAEGNYTTASGDYSHAGGYHTTALRHQFVAGKYNNADTTSIAGVAGVSSADSQSADETLFVIGYGTSTATGNAFRISANGKCRGVSTFTASGADFAELFEWKDGNSNNEDRRGLFVTLEGEKIKLANNGDDFIGVISGAEAFLGNSASEEWQGKYLTDVFGTRLTQTVEIPEKINDVTNEVITPAHTATQYVLNPDYNPNEKYIMRENRKEWGIVGLLGQVVVIDDGTCVAGGYVKPSLNGVGTASDSGYRVMKRIDETHIKVLVK